MSLELVKLKRPLWQLLQKCVQKKKEKAYTKIKHNQKIKEKAIQK